MWRAIAVHPRGRWPEDGMVDAVTLAYLDRYRRRIRLIADMVTGLGGRIVRLEAPVDPEFGAYAGRLHHHADG